MSDLPERLRATGEYCDPSVRSLLREAADALEVAGATSYEAVRLVKAERRRAERAEEQAREFWTERCEQTNLARKLAEALREVEAGYGDKWTAEAALAEYEKSSHSESAQEQE